tara:strand:+ start:32360 stop:33142 length:783 start_codon:yes stop_codon:yes gene_type:complete
MRRYGTLCKCGVPQRRNFPGVRLEMVRGFVLAIALAASPTLTAAKEPLQDCPQRLGSGLLSSSSFQDPARRFLIDLGSVSFSVPWIYLSPRPPKALPACRRNSDSLSFQFWLPDASAPEVETFLGGDLAPLEDNGKVRGPDAGIVKVVKLQSFAGDPSPRADARVFASNIHYIFGDELHIEDHQNSRMITPKDPRDGSYLWIKDGEKARIYVFCNGSAVCRGGFVLSDASLSGTFLILEKTASMRESILPVLTDLLKQWS